MSSRVPILGPLANPLGLLFACLCFTSFLSVAGAQSLAPAPQTSTADSMEQQATELGELSPEERDALLSRLSDEQVRLLLLDYLALRGTAPSEGDAVIADLQAGLHEFRSGLGAQAAEFQNLPAIPGFIYGKLTEGAGPYQPLLVLAVFAAISAIAYGAERGYRHLARRQYASLSQPRDSDALDRLGYLTVRLGLDLVGLAIFAATILGLFFLLYQGHEPSRLLIMTLLSGVLVVRATSIVSRFVFAPYASHLRIAPFDDAVALRIHRWILLATTVGTFALLICMLMLQLGLPIVQHDLVTNLVGVLLVAIIIAATLDVRRPVATALQGQVEGDGAWARFLRALASLWAVAFIAYVLFLFVLAVYTGLDDQLQGGFPGIQSLLIVLALPLADFILRALLDHRFGDDEATEKVRPGSAIPVFKRAARVLLIILAVFLIGRVWGVNFFDLGRQGIGEELMRAIIDIALIILVAYVVWGVIKAAVARYVPNEAAGEEAGPADEGGAGNASRVATILPLIMRFVQITLVVIVVLILLSSLGVDIGPLLAGAGVVGLAIGFGAQALVRDIVSGIFFLLDDAFRKGEYVDIGSVKGTVEQIHIRSLVLRHHLGALHTVPFGEIRHLTNYSRDWVIMKMEFRVPTDTDANQVKKIFKVIGAEMLEHPVLGPDFMEPFKSQGVKSIEDSAMIIRGKFMARPGKQFMIRKELYNRVQKAFQENGIPFAHRKVTVELPSDVQLTDEQKDKIVQAAGAAALAAEEQETQPGATAPEAARG